MSELAAETVKTSSSALTASARRSRPEFFAAMTKGEAAVQGDRGGIVLANLEATPRRRGAWLLERGQVGVEGWDFTS